MACKRIDQHVDVEIAPTLAPMLTEVLGPESAVLPSLFIETVPLAATFQSMPKDFRSLREISANRTRILIWFDPAMVVLLIGG